MVLSAFFQEPSSVLYTIYCLAMILFATKGLGMLMRKIGLPQVVGMVLAGLLIGPAIFKVLPVRFNGILNPDETSMKVLETFSQIGVILILFSSGLETNLGELKRSGGASTAIAIAGVIVPVALGFVAAMFFMPNGWADITNPDAVMNAVFVGIILGATSVGITVETLRELGKLNTRVGTTILSAAIIDDVLGIIVLSVVTSIKGGGEEAWLTAVKMIAFFVLAIGLGILARFLFRWMEKKYPHKRRNSIFALALCFAYAFCAETFFGVAAITGAFMAGVMLSGLGDTQYIDKKVVSTGYIIFSPIFFAFIGISADFSHFQVTDLLFGLIFVLAGVVGKILGCSGAARLCRYKPKDSFRIGCGMIARGEVALAVYAAGKSLIWTGSDGALVGIDPMVATILLILLSSILCPVLLKQLFKKHVDTGTGQRLSTGHDRAVVREGHEPSEAETDCASNPCADCPNASGGEECSACGTDHLRRIRSNRFREKYNRAECLR